MTQTPVSGRRILILDTDLFAQVGGGQSVYRRLIEHRPDDQWFYFRHAESETAPRPVNTRAIPLLDVMHRRSMWQPDRLHPFIEVWRLVRNMARSVVRELGEVDFDVVDVPDYSQYGPFIRAALAQEGCKVGAVVLALHGTLSDAFAGGWPSSQDEAWVQRELRLRENLQFRSADACYAISDFYADEWCRRLPRVVNRIDPLLITGAPDPRPAPWREGAPDLAFIGRREKWKGPDLFLDAAWCLDPDSYRRLLLIGPDGKNRIGAGSEAILQAAAKRRGLDERLEMPGGMTRDEVQALLGDRTLLLLPSRHDTFNLTALEAICFGCPILVSEHAGVAHWLRSRLPELDWAVVGIDCGRGYASAAAEILADYDRRRDALGEALLKANLVPDIGSLETMYAVSDETNVEALVTCIEIVAQLQGVVLEEPPGLRSTVRRTAKAGRAALPGAIRAVPGVVSAYRLSRAAWKTVPVPLRENAHDFASRLRAVTRARGFNAKVSTAIWQTGDAVRRLGGYDRKAFSQIQAQGRKVKTFSDWRGMPEETAREIDAKLASMTGAVSMLLADRVPLFREMARLERLAGNPVTAATYLLRTLRWTGGDARGDLPFIRQSLADAGFAYEAATADAMFGEGPDGQARCFDLMRAGFERNRIKPVLPLAVLDDRRPKDHRPRACVIVSLYNAADKLPTLLGMLSRQSLAQSGGLEVVLVDSNSPGEDRAAFEAFAATHPDLPICYARSAERETIQAAWNRGIRLARAPYLAFLGADEGLHPDALRILAAKLDDEPSVDWVMADSIVTNVDQHGVYDSDIMVYDRAGYRQDLVYLETCYLSWVGALYRRSIHERFGYYDESFRAAGDTEFKNRIMPHISSAHVKLPLGIFNNYPEARTTQHPRAEIEDLRAWYLWRTSAGMDYAFAQRPAEDAERLLADCFGYRKSFCGHLSTDYDLAEALADHLKRRNDGPSRAAEALSEVQQALGVIRSLEEMPSELFRVEKSMSSRLWVFHQLRAARALALQQRDRLALPEVPRFDIFNDNRYEQHWYSWSVG
ncbi:MAG: glycosyltransferase [Roseomonas sp.]|nr:glycosyltransferase [Roseomonas sp.]MCA3344444.1 glycosyltransferase [Roseomonas sp.]